jgi:hypothetical protein
MRLSCRQVRELLLSETKFDVFSVSYSRHLNLGLSFWSLFIINNLFNSRSLVLLLRVFLGLNFFNFGGFLINRPWRVNLLDVVIFEDGLLHLL